MSPEMENLDELGIVGPALIGQQHQSLADFVTDRIADEIVSGGLPAGSRLTEIALAERLGVSRSPIREALRNLSREGLVDLIPRRGAQVAGVSSTDAVRLYECRMLLEPEACRGAVAVVTDQDLATLQALLVDMRSADAGAGMSRFLAANHGYHRRWLSACPNPILRELIELTWLRTERYWRLFKFLPADYIEGSVAYHQRLHAAIADHDADQAAKTLRELLAFALSQLTAYLGTR
jgi:DNA-binding GntR family transcriptional regulator